MNAWFPRIGPTGEILSGNNGIWRTSPMMSPAQISPVGTSPVWAGQRIVYNKNDGTTFVDGVIVPIAYNFYVGSDDGRWAGMVADATGRVDVYLGATKIAEVGGGCDPALGGSKFAYLTPYQSTQRNLIIEPLVVASGTIMKVALSRNGQYGAYQTATSTYKRALFSLDGKDATVRDDEGLILVFIGPDLEPWVMTQTPEVGTLVRPLFSKMGYQITGALFYPDARMDGERLHVVGSGSDGQPRFDVWVDFSQPRIDVSALRPMADIPVIGKSCLFGWFTDGPTPAPGNCDLVVNYYGGAAPSEVMLRNGGQRVMHYVAAETGGTIEALESAVAAEHTRNPSMPVVAYWPRTLQGGRPPSNAEYVGVEAYMASAETPEAFEARVRAAVAKCRMAVLIPNCYTSNVSLTQDLEQVVPPVGRVARDLSNVIGILGFSAGSRATGWNSHPEVQDDWQRLFEGVTGTPSIPPRVLPPQPTPQQPGDIMIASQFDSARVVPYKQLKPSATQGCVNVILPDGRVLSAHGDDRDPGSDGPWEQGQVAGQSVTFSDGSKYYTYLIVPVDKVPA